jgi:hypothetical protein
MSYRILVVEDSAANFEQDGVRQLALGSSASGPVIHPPGE